MASCAVAVLYADARRAHRRVAGGVSAMDTILVVNAGSSSVKFQVFAIDGRARPEAPDQGPDGRHRHAAAAARRAAPTAAPLIDRSYAPERRARRAGRAADSRAHGCASTQKLELDRGRAPRRAWRPATTTGRCWSTPTVLARPRALRARWRRCTSRTTSRRSARCCARSPELPQVACFDTAFHRGHDALADHYAIPRALLRRGRAPLRLPRPVLRIHRRPAAAGRARDRRRAA